MTSIGTIVATGLPPGPTSGLNFQRLFIDGFSRPRPGPFTTEMFTARPSVGDVYLQYDSAFGTFAGLIGVLGPAVEADRDADAVDACAERRHLCRRLRQT